MTRFHEAVSAAIVLAIVAVAACACILLRDLDAKVRAETITQIQAGKINSLVDTLQKAGKDADTEENELAAEYDPKQPGSIPNRIYKLIGDARESIVRTDANLNGGKLCLTCAPVSGFLPTLTLAANHTISLADASTRDLDAAAGAITQTQTELRPILEDSSRASAYFETQLPLILAPMAQAAQSTQTIAANGAKVSANAVAITADAKKYADSKVAPVRKVVSVLHGVENNIGDFVGHVLGGFF